MKFDIINCKAVYCIVSNVPLCTQPCHLFWFWMVDSSSNNTCLPPAASSDHPCIPASSWHSFTSCCAAHDAVNPPCDLFCLINADYLINGCQSLCSSSFLSIISNFQILGTFTKHLFCTHYNFIVTLDINKYT